MHRLHVHVYTDQAIANTKDDKGKNNDYPAPTCEISLWVANLGCP